MVLVFAIWQRIPVLIRAVVIGVAVAAAGSYPWAWLAGANMRHGRVVPWGPAAMAVYLWLYWRFFTGHGWPASTAALRREHSRPRPLSPEVWGTAILAGVLGLATSIVLIRLTGRLIALPRERLGDVSGVPAGTLLATLVMGAVVAGVVEEVSFRGYMQRPIERRFGPVVAILVVGVVFGLAHGTHSEWSLILMPYYVAVEATYGALAWITDSILPSLALHAGGDLLGALQLWLAGRSVLGSNTGGAAAATPPGVDAGFWLNLVVLAAVASAAVWAYRQLAAVVREGRASGAMAPTQPV